jgi:hypothetical protein
MKPGRLFPEPPDPAWTVPPDVFPNTFTLYVCDAAVGVSRRAA